MNTKTNIMKKTLLSIGLLAISFIATAQVGVGTASPDASAALEVVSTDKGFLIPRMTTAQRTAISSPATGLMVYDSDTNTFWFYNASGWVEHNGSGSSLYGADGTLTGERTVTLNSNNIKFTGSNSSESLRIVNNSLPRMVYEAVNNPTDSTKIQMYMTTDGRFKMAFLNDAENAELGAGYYFNRRGTLEISDGASNTVVGSNSFLVNTAGNRNTVVGQNTMVSNTTGSFNTVLGRGTAGANTTGQGNTVIGHDSFNSNTTGNDNVVMGTFSMKLSNGDNNVSVGAGNATNLSTGNRNLLLGHTVGASLTNATLATLVGSGSNSGDNLTNATAIGSLAMVAQSNSLILGSINGINGATADTNVGIGTTTPGSKLAVVGLPEYADNTAATSGGLSVGDFYRTSDGTVKVVF